MFCTILPPITYFLDFGHCEHDLYTLHSIPMKNNREKRRRRIVGDQMCNINPTKYIPNHDQYFQLARGGRPIS